MYVNGKGIDIDMKKAKHHFELTAMAEHKMARHNLGVMEGNSGNKL